MTIADDPATLSPGFKSVGTRPIRPDGFEKVTGRAKFGADLKLPGMLEGAIVRSPHAHARIVSIDTTEAASMPGVKAIITGADFPEPSGNPGPPAQHHRPGQGLLRGPRGGGRRRVDPA
jgi:CO/xanthine dehydrogenase Mo-binding subunit